MNAFDAPYDRKILDLDDLGYGEGPDELPDPERLKVSTLAWAQGKQPVPGVYEAHG